jgi:large subunit ribosomal protein L22
MPKAAYSASTVINYSPRKTRLIINTIRGLKVNQAYDQLRSNSRPKSIKIYQLLKTAINNLQLTDADVENYKVESIVAEDAQRLYRFIPRSRGRADKIARRYARIKVLILPNNKINK